MTASFSDRRPSVAERRPSVATAADGASASSRRPSAIPPLAGLERPLQPIAQDACDVLVCGTGMVESILAAALAWQGCEVVHIDANPYYGDHSATLTIDQVEAWADAVRENRVGFRCFQDVQLDITGDLKSKDFGIDITPKILFAKSDLLTLLVQSRVYHYMEFLPISNFHTFEKDSFGKMMASKEEIFTSDHSLTTKRQLMKMMKFIYAHDDVALLEEHKDTLLSDFIKMKFKLEDKYVNELVYTLGLSASPSIKTIEGIARIKRYLDSFNIYGNFPAIYSKFGGPGELSQGFCRSAAVAGTTYKLNTHLDSFNEKTGLAVLSDGSKLKVSEKVICSPSQAPDGAVNLPKQDFQISRLITVVDKPCTEWFNEGESSALVVFPPKSLGDNDYPIQAFILGPGSGCCAENTSIWYLHTINPDVGKAQIDLNSALGKMEESILREMEFDLEDLDDDDVDQIDNLKNVKFKPQIQERLSNQFQQFKPKSKLTFLLKLKFVQLTSVPPFGIIKPGTFSEEKIATGKPGKDLGVIYSSMPPIEMSYDGVVSEAKVLYKSIVGDDADFFNVDFEDDDEEQEEMVLDQLKESQAAVRDESAVIDSE